MRSRCVRVRIYAAQPLLGSPRQATKLQGLDQHLQVRQAHDWCGLSAGDNQVQCMEWLTHPPCDCSRSPVVSQSSTPASVCGPTASAPCTAIPPAVQTTNVQSPPYYVANVTLPQGQQGMRQKALGGYLTSPGSRDPEVPKPG